MAATTMSGEHVITVRELQEMLSKCEPSDRIQLYDDTIGVVEKDSYGQHWEIRPHSKLRNYKASRP